MAADKGLGQGNAAMEDEVIFNAEHRIPRFRKTLALLERDALDIVVGKKQRKIRKRKAEIVELGDYKYSVFDGTKQFDVDCDYLRAHFPVFCQAMVEWAEEEQFPSADQFICVAAYTLVQVTNRAKRYQVYQRLAWAIPYIERTQFPVEVETAIKETWSDPREVFTGFRKA
jgi:hypothetical protein